jgi:hypothetical protein
MRQIYVAVHGARFWDVCLKLGPGYVTSILSSRTRVFEVCRSVDRILWTEEAVFKSTLNGVMEFLTVSLVFPLFITQIFLSTMRMSFKCRTASIRTVDCAGEYQCLPLL